MLEWEDPSTSNYFGDYCSFFTFSILLSSFLIYSIYLVCIELQPLFFSVKILGEM